MFYPTHYSAAVTPTALWGKKHIYWVFFNIIYVDHVYVNLDHLKTSLLESVYVVGRLTNAAVSSSFFKSFATVSHYWVMFFILSCLLVNNNNNNCTFCTKNRHNSTSRINLIFVRNRTTVYYSHSLCLLLSWSQYSQFL